VKGFGAKPDRLKSPLFQAAVVGPAATRMSVVPSVLAPAGAEDPAMKLRVALAPAQVPFCAALLRPLKSRLQTVAVGVAVGTGVPQVPLTVTAKPLLLKGAPPLLISVPASTAWRYHEFWIYPRDTESVMKARMFRSETEVTSAIRT
jgi:hypothetical protein